MAESSYLRYPHVAGDLITFVAEDDVWLASLSAAAEGRGTRAWRLTADQVPVLHPRLNPPATHVAWTSTRDGARSFGGGASREAYAVPVDGGPVKRLTYWGDRFATVRGWASDNTQGGDAGQIVAEKLARRIIGWMLSRYEEPLSYPADAPRGPIVAITDGYASSGGDLVNQALKANGIATVVGTRTWGGVLGVDLRYTLVDGTLVAQPKYAWWFAGVGWTLENHGVEPDVEVTIAPHDWAAGRDPQLDTAVRLALQALDQRPPAAPPTV